MHRNWKLFTVAVLTAAVAGIACRGAPHTFYAAAYKGKLNPKKAQLIVMPVDIRGFPKKDTVKMNLTLFAGTLAAFGGSALSLQPFLPAFETTFKNLSWRLAEGIFHMASFHRSIRFDACVGHMTWMPEMLNDLVKFIDWAAQMLKLDFKPKYVISAHVDGYGAKWGGKVKPYRVIGGMVNAPAKVVIGAAWYRSTCPNNTAGYMSAMGTLGKQIKGAMKPLFGEN